MSRLKRQGKNARKRAARLPADARRTLAAHAAAVAELERRIDEYDRRGRHEAAAELRGVLALLQPEPEEA